MDNRVNDYKNYDKLVLYVKDNKTKDIIKYYQALGYTLVNTQPNYKYADTQDLTFVRQHKIENKDALQLLQVHLEVELNKIGKCEQYKHSASINLGVSLGALSILLLVLGIFQLINCPFLAGKIISAVIAFLGLLVMLLMLIFLPKIVKKENKSFLQKTEKIKLNIDKIIKNINKARCDK